MGEKSRSGSGVNIPDNIYESLETIFGVKILEFFDADPDPGSGLFFTVVIGIWNLFDPGSRIWDGKNAGPEYPDPQHWAVQKITGPDPGGTKKTYGSYGSGSGTLVGGKVS
jgi:hypothetical protein